MTYFPDANVFMNTNDLTHLISADTHFDAIEGITRVDPRRPARLKG